MKAKQKTWLFYTLVACFTTLFAFFPITAAITFSLCFIAALAAFIHAAVCGFFEENER